MFAQKLAEAGYVTIACDARYQGQSGGMPRGNDIPTVRMGDTGRVRRNGYCDSRYMTEEAMEKATGTQEKEMFVVPGASHIKTYYEHTFVEQERAKVVAFFDKYLK